MAGMKKNSAAVALGRKGGLKGGVARAASLTAAQRSASASKAVRARWAKAGVSGSAETTKKMEPVKDTSDQALVALLAQLRAATDMGEVRILSERIERVVFHKQMESA